MSMFMDKAPLVELSAVEVLAAFKERSFTPVDYLSACLEHISRFNPAINALTIVDAARATVQASESAKRWQSGTPIGPLDGLPIGVKDLQDTKGLLTTHGSIAGRGRVPDSDLLTPT